MGASESTPTELGAELSEELVLRALRNADEALGSAGRYEAGKLEEGRKVVVKVFKDLQSEDCQKIRRRLTALGSMEQHAHLLLPVSWCQQAERCYVVYDMLDPQDASKRLALSRKGEKEFAWADRLRLGAAVASALSHLRSCTLGSPHLNLKLSSVLFDRTGQVKLADLGFEGELLQSASATLSKDAEVKGAGLAEQQVAELWDLGRLLLALLLPDDAAVESAATAAARGLGANGEALESQLPRLRRGRAGGPGAPGVPEASLLRTVLGSPLDRSAAWPLPFACAVADVALTCAAAEADGSKPPPGMASIAGKLLQQAQACISQAGVAEKSKADFSGFYAGFECTYSSGLDVEKLPHELRRWPFEPEQPPWLVGRQHQLELLSRLVPSRQLFTSIGRTHFELWPEPDKERPTLRLQPMSPNPLQVDERPVVAGESESEGVSIRDGSTVSFCFQGEVFLTLQFLIRRGVEAAPTQEALQLPLDTVPTVARSSPAAYALVCDRLAGEAADHLPKEERKISISSEGPTSIGRQCQPGFFENLQKLSRSQWGFVHFVSRTHFQVTGLAEDLPPSKQRFEVTNCSSNPIVLAGKELPGRARQVIQVGDTVELIAQDGTGVAPYLRFRLLWLGQSRSTSSLASRATTPGTILLDRQDSKEISQKRPPFQLCLAGSAVVKGLPDALRVVDAGDNGLTIGRAHQRELHEKAFVEGVLGYISRDHFSIKCSRDGAFSLVPLSQNPIWLSRRGRLQRLMVGDAPPRLEDGDTVLLFTGAEDLSPEGPGSFGSLRWVFRLSRP